MEKLGYAPQALKRGGIVGILAKAEQAGMGRSWRLSWAWAK